jgi:hypothetical protein
MRGDRRGETQPSAALDAVLGAAGITQYRGYFEAGEERYAPTWLAPSAHDMYRSPICRPANVEHGATQRMPPTAN